MGRPGAPALFLGALAVLLSACEGSSSTSHSLRYFYTGVSEPNQGLPKFIAVGYVDGQLFVQYDSNTKIMESQVPWMKKEVVEEDPHYWEWNTQNFRGSEEVFRVGVETIRNYYNLSKGFHSLQWMYGCELRPDGSKGGYDQHAYDGRDYLSFDMETLTWTAADPKAQNTKRKWEREPAIAQRQKAYYEEICIEWLQRYLEYGKETLLRTGSSSSSSSSHSLHYFYTAVSEPNRGLPQFVAVGYVDGQPITHFDSSTRRKVPVVPWMKEVEKDDHRYWDWGTELLRATEETFRVNVETARNYYNLSKGFHTGQRMYGCELRPDGSKEGYDQYAYNGRDFISFDKETLTWTAVDLPAQNTKRKLEREPAIAQRQKAYLEEECIEWLQRYLEYGKETLLRTERPEGKVTRKAGFDDTESLVCQAYGFYPKEIELTWRKDGEVLHEDTFHRNTAPYPDGTYHAWLSITIDPKNRDQYRCHVEHASLAEPLVLAWEEPASNLGLIVGCVVAAVLLIAAVTAGSYVYLKKRQEGYKATSTSEGGSNSSSRGSDPTTI